MKRILALLLATVMTMSLAACGGGDAKKDPAPQDPSTSQPEQKPEPSKKLIVGTSADYAPYEFHKLVDGKDTIMGFDMALAAEIAKDMGMELEIKDMDFKILLGELENGTIDMIIAGFSPKPGRDVAFSDIYYEATQSIIVSKDMATTYKDIASLAGKSVGAQTGSIQEIIVNEDMTESVLVSLAKIPNLVAELKAGKIEALVMEGPVAVGYLGQHPDLAMAFSVEEDTAGSAVAVKKGNEALLADINKTIKRLQDDGTMDKFVAEANEQAEY